MELDAMDTGRTSSSDLMSPSKRRVHEWVDGNGRRSTERGSIDGLLTFEIEDEEPAGPRHDDASMETIALKALHTDDDPTLNPWTFRMFFLGMPFYPRIHPVVLTCL
jgi:hypothetical protein